MQEKIAMYKRTFFMFLLLGIALMPPVWGQSVKPGPKPEFNEYDSRDLSGAAAPASLNEAEARLLMAVRRANTESFLASARKSMPGTRIDMNRYGVPKLFLRDGNTLSAPSQMEPERIAKDFLLRNSAVYSLAPFEVDSLRVLGRDVTKDSTFLTFNQTINGIDVFNGHVKFLLNRYGAVIQVSTGDVAPGIKVSTTPRLTPEEALKAAFVSLKAAQPAEFANISASNGKYTYVNPKGGGYSPITAELSIFPVTAASARLAYRIFLEIGPESWFEMLIDAENARLLYRHNLHVYEASGLVWPQSPAYGFRESVTFPETWIPADSTVTTGNNVDAYVDADYDGLPDPINTDSMVNGRAYSAARTFGFPFADGLTGNDPRNYQPASTTNLFYFVNRAHDYFYGLGFTEASWNFQNDNFGRGGAAGDGVIALDQYGAFTNNASMSTPPEGTAPRMRMGIFTNGTSQYTDDLDSAFDGGVVVHEYTHGVSTRLVGAGYSIGCLYRIQSGAMGEGWSDYFAASLFNNPVMGAYVTQDPVNGVRRQNYDNYTYTYEDIGNEGSYEVHNDGEIWAATLWDLRKSLGMTVTDQLVINGLKSTPCNPSMIAARDAIMSADEALHGGANRTAIWQVFARHGMGYSARGIEGNSTTGVLYDAAYDMPQDLQTLKNPAVTSNPLSITAAMGVPYSYQIIASNPNNGVLRYELLQGPGDMTISSTGLLSWPSPNFIGQRIKVRITDGLGGSVVHGFYIPMNVILHDSVSVTVSAPSGTIGTALISVPAGVPALQVTTRDGSGISWLILRYPGENLAAISARLGTNQTLTLPNPESGTWQVQVYGLLDYANVTLRASFIVPTALSLPANLSGLSSDTGNELLFRIPVPFNTSRLTVATSGGYGDVDVFLKEGRTAACQYDPENVESPCQADYGAQGPTSSETIEIQNPSQGDWYLSLAASSSFSGVALSITTVSGGGTSAQLSIPGGGAGSSSPGGETSSIKAGYATLALNSGTAPYGTAVFSYRENGAVISEAGVSASSPTNSARIFIDYRADVQAVPGNAGSGRINVNTGIAIVNPGSTTAHVTYTLRNMAGVTIASGSGDLAGGAHFARFINSLADEAPDFQLPADFATVTMFGSLDISSSQPVAVLALRGTDNQDKEFLLTTTPMADLTKSLGSDPAYFPRFLDGGGYTTSLALMNTSGATESGSFRIMDKNGNPVTVTQAGGEAGSSFTYSIPPNGALRFQTSGAWTDIKAGWVKLIPDPGMSTPVGTGVFSYNPGSRLISESGIEAAVATTHARIYVDLSGNHNTGLAITNVSDSTSYIDFMAFDKDGYTEVGYNRGTLELSGNGYEALFVGDFVGGLPAGFSGVLDISSDTPFAALTLRSLNNERNDFLMTTFPVADADRPAPTSIVFPQIVKGGGYASQFILISPAYGAETTLRFYGEDGVPWNMSE
jgi:Zn-dependent metalloprotease